MSRVLCCSGLLAAFLVLAVLNGCASNPEPVERSTFHAETAKTWQSCAACHAAPDSQVPTDEYWVGLNMTTACLKGDAASEERRRDLVDYLRSGLAEGPKLIRASKNRASISGYGVVTLPDIAGNVYLRKSDSTMLRLSWNGDEEGRQVVVPCGDYAVVSYQFVKSDAGGETWIASATNEQEPVEFEVVADKPIELPISAGIAQDLSVTSSDDAFNLSFQLRNARGDRMTLNSAGSLIKPTWSVLDSNGTQLDTGGFGVT